MAWIIRQPEPSNIGEPQSVRDKYDQLTAEAEAEEVEAE